MPYIDPSVIAQAKQIDLLTYLQEREPDELEKIGANTYATKTHSSLKISNGKWYWWSRGVGGRSALDYLVKVRDMKFVDAINHLSGHFPAPITPRKEPVSQPKRFVQPQPHSDPAKAVAYLQSRGIGRSIIEHCIKTGIVYESQRIMLTTAPYLLRLYTSDQYNTAPPLAYRANRPHLGHRHPPTPERLAIAPRLSRRDAE